MNEVEVMKKLIDVMAQFNGCIGETCENCKLKFVCMVIYDKPVNHYAEENKDKQKREVML